MYMVLVTSTPFSTLTPLFPKTLSVNGRKLPPIPRGLPPPNSNTLLRFNNRMVIISLNRITNVYCKLKFLFVN